MCLGRGTRTAMWLLLSAKFASFLGELPGPVGHCAVG